MGPLLFILAFDGIFRVPLSEGSLLVGYADDVTYTKAVMHDCDLDTINEDLGCITSWISTHGLRLNLSKVKQLVISRKKHPPPAVITINGSQIERVPSFKLLGVLVQSDLSWRLHIQDTCYRSKRLLGFIYRVFSEADRHYLCYLFKTLVLPILDYASCIWDPHYAKHNLKLERVQSFAARIATRSWSAEATPLKRSLHWPLLSARRKLQKISLCRRILSGASLVPDDLFQRHPHPGKRSHKNSSPLYHPFVRTLHHKAAFHIAVVDLWNSVPEEVVCCTSDKSFKRRLKAWLLVT